MSQSEASQEDHFGAFVAFSDRSLLTDHGSLKRLRFAVKDLVETSGRLPSYGLSAPSGPLPQSDAPVLTRLLSSGTSLTGFTKMTPLAYEPSGDNPVQGRPQNPWSARHICGGSSSGSAVAVAARLVDFALGSDTGGSLRIPAHCCGVAAWKPTYGLVPVAGTMELAPSLDTLGFIANECEILLHVASVFDAQSCTPISSVRVARDVALGFAPDIVAGLERAASALRSLGYSLADAEISPLITACDSPVLTVMQAEAARVNLSRIEAGGLDATLSARLRKGMAIDAAALLKAKNDLHLLAENDWLTLLGASNAVLLPVMRNRTPEVNVCDPTSPQFSPRTLYELSALTRWVNGLGLPAVAIPVGLDGEGLPIAVQLVGCRGSDLTLLGLACALQSAVASVPPAPASYGSSA